MPTQQGAVTKKFNAIDRINAAAARLTGGQAPAFEAPSLRKSQKWLQETRAYEAMADWLEQLGGVDVVNEGQSPVPLEYLTVEGLRWVAETRGVDIEESTRKSEMLDQLRGI